MRPLARAGAGLLVALSALLAASPARAEPSTDPAPVESRRSIKLFDTRHTLHSWVLDVGPIWHRQVQDETPQQQRTGFERGAPLAGEIGVGSLLKTPYGRLFLLGGQRMLLRVLNDKSFSWSILHQDLGGGLLLGPFEPEVRVGVSLLTVDIFRAEPSIQLLTPRVGAGFGIHVGRMRVDVKAHAEYLWRWFGPDYLIRGITIGLQLDMPRKTSPFPTDR